jgi:hypothetical protein
MMSLSRTPAKDPPMKTWNDWLNSDDSDEIKEIVKKILTPYLPVFYGAPTISTHHPDIDDLLYEIVCDIPAEGGPGPAPIAITVTIEDAEVHISIDESESENCSVNISESLHRLCDPDSINSIHEELFYFLKDHYETMIQSMNDEIENRKTSLKEMLDDHPLSHSGEEK